MPLLLLLAFAALPGETADITPPLRIENAWLREAPPVAKVQAAYARLCNDDKEALTLVHVASEDFDRVEMHASTETEGAVTMEQLDSVVVAPGDCVDFAPGGRHFMLFDARRALRAGDSVEFTITFASGAEMSLRLPVRRADEMIRTEHGQHHGH